MTVKQVKDLVNEATREILGEDEILNEDLSNVVDIGESIFNARQYENYVNKLVDVIGKTIFVNRPYARNVLNVMRDRFEFGSVVEKIRCDLPDADENESWQLTDGTIYEQDQFYAPKISVKFFNSKTTFEIDVSFTMKQVESSFKNAETLTAFINMIYNSINNSMTIKIDSLIMRTVMNFIAETIHADYGSSALSSKSGVKAVNLLYKYNTKHGTSLTTDDCLYDKDFLRYSASIIKQYIKRMQKMSVLFNIGGTQKFTPRDLMHVVLLDEYVDMVDTYAQSDTWHNELTSLPYHETVPYWQGTGEEYEFEDTSSIDVKSSAGNTVKTSGILGVIFDHDALGVCNTDERVLTHTNKKAEFTNNFYKYDASYFNDLDENFVVFFIA